MAAGIPARLTPGAGRRFAFPVGGVFLAVAVLSLWRGHRVAPTVLGGLGALLVLAGAVLPSRLGPVLRAWTALAQLLSRVTTPIVLGLIYFLLLTPIALLLRLWGRNPLRHAERAGSFWVAPESGGRSNLTAQF